MRIAVFSDIHGNLQALNAILEDIKNEEFDEVIFLGDVIGIGPKPKECLELLLNSDITLISGNHDLYYKYGIELDNGITEAEEIEHHKWIHSEVEKIISRDEMKEMMKKEIYINGKKFSFQHYMLSEDTSVDPYPFLTISIKNMKDIEDYCRNMEYDYLFIGHEHKHFVVEKNGKMIYCVGSSGCVRDNKTFYTILDVGKDIKITRKELEFDREGLLKDIESYEYPDQKALKKGFFGISD